MKATLGLALSAAACAAVAADVPSSALAGRYYRQFLNSFVSGEKYTGEHIVEIVPVTANAAYVRIHLDYYNGHSCTIQGIAQSEGDTLVYRDPSPAFDEFRGKRCVLKLRRAGKSLSIDDGEGTCLRYCGARGTLSRVSLPYGSKRPIRYIRTIKASEEYKAALIEWRTGKPYEPWKQSAPRPAEAAQPVP